MAVGSEALGLTKNGCKVPIEIRLNKGKGTEDTVVYACITDLTDKKRIRQQLSDSNERFERIINGAKEGFWELNCETDELWLSPKIMGGFDLSQNENAPTLTRWLKCVTEENRVSVARYIRDYAEEKSSSPITFLAQSTSGEYRWYIAKAGNTFDDTGKRLYRSGTLLDIHAQTLLEEKFKNQELRYRNIVNKMPLGLHVYQIGAEDSLLFSDSNSMADDILNIKSVELISQPLEQAFPNLLDTGLVQKCQELAVNGGFFENTAIHYSDERISGIF